MRKKIILLYVIIIGAMRSFAIAPVAISPANNAINIPTQCGFNFSHASNETYYDIELDTTASFSSALHVLHLGTIDFSAKNPGNTVGESIKDLKYNQVYYWRARTRNATDTSVWTTIYSFRTVGAPKITFPQNNDIVNPASFFVYTDHNVGNRVYYMNFATDPSFTYPIYYQQSLDVTTINVTYYQGQNIGIGINYFSNNGTFYMRMRVSNNADTSGWSEVVGFQIHGNIAVPHIVDDDIAVYPNPASSQFILKNITAGDILSISDISGKIIETRISTGTTEWFDCTALNSGLYFVQIRRENAQSTIKFNVVH